jgi:hypothetical protein
VQTPSGSLAAAVGMVDANWKTVVDMKMYDVRVDIAKLKAAVVKVESALTGFANQMRGIASQAKRPGGEDGCAGSPFLYPQDAVSSEPAPENQIRCPKKPPERPQQWTPEKPTESDGVLRCVQVQPSSLNMKRREEALTIADQRRKVQAPVFLDENNSGRGSKTGPRQSERHPPPQQLPRAEKVMQFEAYQLRSFVGYELLQGRKE